MAVGGRAPRTEAGGWLWTIAARLLVDARRAQERVARVVAPLPEPEGPGRHESDAAPSAEDRVLAGLEYGDVGTALDRISPELREVLRATVGGRGHSWRRRAEAAAAHPAEEGRDGSRPSRRRRVPSAREALADCTRPRWEAPHDPPRTTPLARPPPT